MHPQWDYIAGRGYKVITFNMVIGSIFNRVCAVRSSVCMYESNTTRDVLWGLDTGGVDNILSQTFYSTTETKQYSP